MKDLIAHGIKLTNKHPDLLGQINDRIKQCQEKINENIDSENHEINLAYIAINGIIDLKKIDKSQL